jgi:hypothetical protein
VLLFTWIGLTLADHGRKLRRAELTLFGAILTSAALSISCVGLLVARSSGGLPRFYSIAFGAWIILALPLSLAVAIWHLKITTLRARPDVPR